MCVVCLLLHLCCAVCLSCHSGSDRCNSRRRCPNTLAPTAVLHRAAHQAAARVSKHDWLRRAAARAADRVSNRARASCLQRRLFIVFPKDGPDRVVPKKKGSQVPLRSRRHPSPPGPARALGVGWALRREIIESSWGGRVSFHSEMNTRTRTRTPHTQHASTHSSPDGISKFAPGRQAPETHREEISSQGACPRPGRRSCSVPRAASPLPHSHNFVSTVSIVTSSSLVSTVSIVNECVR